MDELFMDKNFRVNLDFSLIKQSYFFIHSKRLIFLIVISFGILPNYALSYPVDINDLYRKQLNFENEVRNMYVDLISKISYSGNKAKTEAELNFFNCEKYFPDMKDFGNYTQKERSELTSYQKFFAIRLSRCMALEGFFHHLPVDIRYYYFNKFPSEMSGQGKHPYEFIWDILSNNKIHLDIILKNIDSLESYKYNKCLLTNTDDTIYNCKHEEAGKQKTD